MVGLRLKGLVLARFSCAWMHRKLGCGRGPEWMLSRSPQWKD
ncbi:MAG: hypothetical protein QHH74_05215 [Spirochaetota bacterium]|nr:hypothetical protein [Spirochaetota bacterium]